MLIGGHPVHYTYEGDPQEAAKWLPIGQRELQACISSGMPSRTIRPSQDVEVQCEWLGGIGKLHIKAGSTPHGFSFIPASNLTHSGWGKPFTPTNSPWGTPLLHDEGTDPTIGQSSVTRSYVTENGSKKPKWSLNHHSNHKGGRIGVVSPSGDVYSVKGYEAGWLAKAVHGKRSFIGSQDPGNPAALGMACYDMDVVSPVYKNGEKLELSVVEGTYGSTKIKLDEVVGIGITKANDKESLIGICVTDLANGIYSTFVSRDFKTVTWTGEFVADNQINFVRYPMVFFFNRSGTIASGILHEHKNRIGDQISPTFDLSSYSVESRAIHANFANGVLVEASYEAETPFRIIYVQSESSSGDSESDFVTAFNGTFITGEETTRTIAIGYDGDIEKRLRVTYSMTSSETTNQVSHYINGSEHLGGGKGFVEPPYESSGSESINWLNHQLDYIRTDYVNTVHIAIKFAINEKTISVYDGDAISEISSGLDPVYRGGEIRWALTNGSAPLFYQTEASWESVYADIEAGHPPPGRVENTGPGIYGTPPYDSGGTQIGVQYVGGQYWDNYPTIGPWAFGITKLYYKHRAVPATTYSGLFAAKVPYINLISVDLVNDTVFYDYVEIERNWPVIGWQEYDQSSGSSGVRKVMANNEVLFYA